VASGIDPTEIRRILIIKWSAMGDVVMATAVMEDVFRAFPGRQIDLNTTPAWAGLFRHDPRFHEVFAIDVRKKGDRFRNNLAWIKRVRAGRYDLVIDLQGSDHSRSLLALLGLTGAAPRFRLGNRGGFPYNLPSEPLPTPAHAIDIMRAAIRGGGIPAVTPRPVLYPSPEHLQNAASIMAAHGLAEKSFGLFLPGSQAAGWLKRWGAARYAELARRLHEAGTERIAIVGGPDEIKECAAIADACGDWAVNLCGKTAILELVPIAQAARFIVANDTGTAHVASVADTPMLVICGPTDPRRIKPIGDNVVALQADLPCINCYGKTCKLDGSHACMAAITPELGQAHLEALLAGTEAPPDAAGIRLRQFR
jgi:heptosyltransferase-2